MHTLTESSLSAKDCVSSFSALPYLVLSLSCRDTGTVNFLLLFTDQKRDSMHISFMSGRNKSKTQLTLALRPSFQLYCISIAGVWPQETSQWEGGRDIKGWLGTGRRKVQKHHPISLFLALCWLEVYRVALSAGCLLVGPAQRDGLGLPVTLSRARFLPHVTLHCLTHPGPLSPPQCCLLKW